MKTTVKISDTLRAVTSPSALGGVWLEFKTTTPGRADMTDLTSTERYHFTGDQWNALMFGGDMALETVLIVSQQSAPFLVGHEG